MAAYSYDSKFGVHLITSTGNLDMWYLRSKRKNGISFYLLLDGLDRLLAEYLFGMPICDATQMTAEQIILIRCKVNCFL